MKAVPVILLCLLMSGNPVMLLAEQAPVVSVSSNKSHPSTTPASSTSTPSASTKGALNQPSSTLPIATDTAASDKLMVGKNLGKSVAHGARQPGQMAQPPAIVGGIVQVTLGLLVVLMVIAGAAWFARRFGHFNATAKGNLRIIGGLPMGSRERVVLLQVGDKQLLLGVAPGRIEILHVLDEPLSFDADNSTPPAQTFSALLKRFQR
jgi:flagellar protein FliO/FliZ